MSAPSIKSICCPTHAPSPLLECWQQMCTGGQALGLVAIVLAVARAMTRAAAAGMGTYSIAATIHDAPTDQGPAILWSWIEPRLRDAIRALRTQVQKRLRGPDHSRGRSEGAG